MAYSLDDELAVLIPLSTKETMMRAPLYHLLLVLFVELLLGSSAVLTEPGGFRDHVCVK